MLPLSLIHIFVVDGDAAALLAAVLQGVEGVVTGGCDLDVVPGIDAEDAAGLVEFACLLYTSTDWYRIDDHALIGFAFPGQELEQCCFSAAICADQSNFIAGMNLKLIELE